MTDGERARLQEWQSIFAVASTKVVSNSIECVTFAGISMALGAVLEDPYHFKNLMGIIQRLKSMGVEPAKSVIEKPTN